MSDTGKAVFLSYASQDAEAAKKICEALRASGVEVWFDAEGGLEHGDEWDAKIRRQIKECVLFIPVISANTQAREEGYFRIEWDLAAERARGIASGVAFILPVVVDDTREPDALVPDRFRAVQWTKLRGGEMAPEVKQRFLKLWSHRAGVVKNQEIVGRGRLTPPTPPDEAGSGDPALQRTSAREAIGKPGMKTYATLAACVVALMALLGWWFTRKGEAKLAAPVAVTAQEFPRDPELKRVHQLIYSLDAIAEDYLLADDIVKPILAARPNDAEVVTVAAEVSQEFLTRGFDTSEARRAQVQSLTERAVRLAPDSPEALAALGRYLLFINAQLDRAEELLRRAIELKPNEPRFYRTLYSILSVKKPAEADVFGELMAAKFPTEPLIAYDIARRYKDGDDLVRGEEWFDKSLAIAPVAFAMTWKAWYMLEVHGDVAGMKAWLDRVPERQRANTRVVNAYCVYALLTGDTKIARQLLEGLTDRWLTDFDFTGPKALLLGDILRMEGREELATVQYETALTELRKMAVRDPADIRMRRSEVWILLALGRRDEARASLRLVVQGMTRPYHWGMRNSWWTSSVRASLLLDEREQALTLLKEGCTDSQGRLLLRNVFRLDPQMAPFRDDAEIKTLLKEPAGTAPVAATPSKPPAPARELAEQARDLLQAIETTREDFALADDLLQRALKLDPTDGEIWAVASQLDAAYSYRGWDNSPERREQMRVRAERAIRLAPNSPNAKLAQAGAWRQFRINGTETEKLIREVLEQRPDDKRAWGFLAAVLLSQGRVDESIAINDRTAAMPGGDPLGLFNKSRTLENANRLEEAYAAAQAAVAQKQFASALVQLMRLEINWRGDLDAAVATLSRIPASALLEDRANYTTGLLHFYRRDPEAALAVWRTFPRDFFDDPMLRAPKGLLLGEAHRMAGHLEAAQLEWRAALQVVEKRLAATPGEVVLLRNRVILQALLADPAAADSWRLFEQVAGLKFSAERPMTEPQAQVLLALGRKEEVLAQLPASIASPGRSNLSAAALRLDPHYDPVRDDPRFRQLLEKYPLPGAGKLKTENGKSVVGGSSSAKASEDWSGVASAPDQKSVAVLAFANLSDDKNNEYFSDGISEELLNVLAKVPGLKVSARTSSFHFKGKDTPIPEIARQLGVAYVVEGSVRRAGDKVRITAQLIKAADGFHVWSDTFTRDLKDIFAVQDEIAGLVAQQLQVKLGTSKAAREVNPEAHRLVLEGRHFWGLRTENGFNRAEEAYRRAIALDPEFAPAHAGLALVLGTRLAYVAYLGELIRPGQEQRAAAQRALAIDPAQPEAIAALGQAYFQEGRDAESAEEYRKGLALNPNAALLHHWYSLTLENSGRLDEALAEITRATELDPLSGIALLTRERMLFAAGRYIEALDLQDRVVGLLPDVETSFGMEAMSLLKLGRTQEAAEAARKVTTRSSLNRRIMVDAHAVHVLRQTGHEKEAAEHAAAIMPRFHPTSYQRGAVLVALGKWEEGVPFLERTPRTVRYLYYWDPTWDAWRDDPRFQQLIKKLGCEAEYRLARETLVRLAKEREAKK